MTEWRSGLEKAQQAQLDNQTDLLERADVSLLPGLMAGPIAPYSHIFKLQIGGKIRLRPLLCRGPVNAKTELTLLLGAKEVNRRWEPLGAPESAETRRMELVGNLRRRQPYDPD